MPKSLSKNENLPLPYNWEVRQDYDGKIYYIDHTSRITTWVDPRDRINCMPCRLSFHINLEIQNEAKSRAHLAPFFPTRLSPLIQKAENNGLKWTVGAADVGWGMREFPNHLHNRTRMKRIAYTKPETFADCIGNELPVGWEEAFDPQIGLFYINHNNQCTQLEDPRLEWKSMQEDMLREYVTSAEDQLEAKKEIYDIKQQRLLLAQDEFNHLNALAASRTSLCSSASSCSTKFDPDLLRADLVLAKERVYRLRKEMARIQTEMTYTQKGVETLHGVELKLSNHTNGCYNITEAQAIMEEVRKIQKSLMSGEKEKKELMHSLAQVKEDLTRLQLRQESPDASTFNLHDRVSAASQTDMCPDSFPIGAREMAKLRMKYDDWRKRVKEIQEKLANLEERIRPGELESDQDRLLLFQEKKQLLLEYRSISPKSRSEDEMIKIKQLCKKLESDLNNAYEESNQCIASRLKLHEEKQQLLQELLEALREVTHLENQLKSVSASTLSISSGSSMGSLSTASSKGSLSGISFTDIYGDPLSTEPRIDMVDISRKIQRFLPPSASDMPLSSRNSLSTETPPASPMKIEPMYENAQEALAALYEAGPSTSQSVLDCVRLEEHLQDLKIKPLSPIYEKPSLLDIPQSALSRSSSASNTHSVSVSAAVSDESVAGDSGVFEASRASTQLKESAQIQITLKYLTEEGALLITIERARNLTVLGFPTGCQSYIKAILLPATSGNPVILRTKTFNEFMKPVFGSSVQVPISLNKVYTKSLQIKIMILFSQKEDWVGSTQISLAEFTTHQDGNSKWYNIISRQIMNETDVEENLMATREESSDESTVISSQTSTLTRNQGHDEMQQQAVLAMSLQEQLVISDDEESDEEGEDEACGCIKEDVYDDDSTAQMLETYMNEVQNFDILNIQTVDAQTNTEFLPEYQQQRNAMMRLRDRVGSVSTTSLRDPTIYPTEDRSSLVKRSQTFSPSAVTACKSRYICRRSDSDSAMHFNITSAVAAQPHPFRRGAVERRSLRYHTKVPRLHSTKVNPGAPPRTSLDLELDLKAQQSRLESLNDEITRLRELKQRLEQARDANDFQIANWALENEDFKNLVETYSANSVEDRRMQKLLRKTSKEIYKLRKTKVEKNMPDMISFKEKMAFFTRRGASSVPEIPSSSTSLTNDRETTEEDAKKFNYVIDRDGVEV